MPRMFLAVEAYVVVGLVDLVERVAGGDPGRRGLSLPARYSLKQVGDLSMSGTAGMALHPLLQQRPFEGLSLTSMSDAGPMPVTTTCPPGGEGADAGAIISFDDTDGDDGGGGHLAPGEFTGGNGASSMEAKVWVAPIFTPSPA